MRLLEGRAMPENSPAVTCGPMPTAPDTPKRDVAAVARGEVSEVPTNSGEGKGGGGGIWPCCRASATRSE